MNKQIIFAFLIIGFLLNSCIEKSNTEEEMPAFELLSPLPCDTIYFGEQYLFEVKFTDNAGLGSLYMDLHNNFGHHSHGEHESCAMDAVKDAVNPYYNDWNIKLPEDSTSYLLKEQINFEEFSTEGGTETKWDEGDYHFHIYITDKDGNQVFTALDVKMLYRTN